MNLQDFDALVESDETETLLIDAIQAVFKRAGITLKSDELADSFPLEHDYYELLEYFTDHLKSVFVANQALETQEGV